jgi:hypothetical protein
VVERLRAFLGTVAYFAVLSEFSLVLVVLGMAIVTAALAELVLTIDVARHARNGRVLALQRKLRMIEVFAARSVEVQRGSVAFGTIRTKLPLVLVVVAIDAVELVGAVDAPGMAALAVIFELWLRVEAG